MALCHKVSETIYKIFIERTWNWSPCWCSGLGGSSPIELHGGTTNVEQLAKYVEDHIL
jgi:hypothetical protein